MPSPLPPEIFAKVSLWPDPARQAFDRLRAIILETGHLVPEIAVVETLKWGQPAWLPDRPRFGSTLRAGWSADRPDALSLFVHCQTTLAEDMRSLYPDAFIYEGSRALHIPLAATLPEQAIGHCAHLTLTYHRKTA
jgi:hypothetical protein